jgi:hypothetical protein
MCVLPQEIIDKIFLELDYENLEETRAIQSEYVQKCTEYFNITDASKNGNLENMKWLKEQGCPWNDYTFEYAATNGNLENMKWLKEQGCSLNIHVFNAATENGNLENMKWLKEQGCPWNTRIFYHEEKMET